MPLTRHQLAEATATLLDVARVLDENRRNPDPELVRAATEGAVATAAAVLATMAVEPEVRRKNCHPTFGRPVAKPMPRA